jgi:hypothetical protein
MNNIIIKRFLRGFVAAVSASLALVIANNQLNVSDINSIYQTLVTVIFQSGIAGGLLAIDKAVREFSRTENEEYNEENTTT